VTGKRGGKRARFQLPSLEEGGGGAGHVFPPGEALERRKKGSFFSSRRKGEGITPTLLFSFSYSVRKNFFLTFHQAGEGDRCRGSALLCSSERRRRRRRSSALFLRARGGSSAFLSCHFFRGSQRFTSGEAGRFFYYSLSSPGKNDILTMREGERNSF